MPTISSVRQNFRLNYSVIVRFVENDENDRDTRNHNFYYFFSPVKKHTRVFFPNNRRNIYL